MNFILYLGFFCFIALLFTWLLNKYSSRPNAQNRVNNRSYNSDLNDTSYFDFENSGDSSNDDRTDSCDSDYSGSDSCDGDSSND